MLFRCIRTYTLIYPQPIEVRRGDRVQVGRHDTDWPSFRWCTGPDGREGWMPENLLDEHEGHYTANTDYSAAELEAKEGDVVLGLHENGGWWWCRNSKGACGWLPETHLQMQA